MAYNPWLRLWNDMPNDPKWRTIAHVSGQPITCVISVYVHLLSGASQAEERGSINPNIEDLSSALDITQDCIASILAAMEGRVCEDGHLTGWTKRQPEREDDSSNRVREFRQRKADECNAKKQAVTQCNARGEERRGEEKRVDKEQVPSSISSTPLLKVTAVITEWNTLTAGKLPKAKLTPKRTDLIRTRLKEPGWLADFTSACTYLAASPWHTGSNDRTWVANIDYALQAGKATELAEKATQPRGLGATGNGTRHHRSATDDDFARQLIEHDAHIRAISSTEPQPGEGVQGLF